MSAWVDEDLLRRVDALAEAKQKETGLYSKVHRSDILRMVLEENIDRYIENLKHKEQDHGEKQHDGK